MHELLVGALGVTRRQVLDPIEREPTIRARTRKPCIPHSVIAQPHIQGLGAQQPCLTIGVREGYRAPKLRSLQVSHA